MYYLVFLRVRGTRSWEPGRVETLPHLSVLHELCGGEKVGGKEKPLVGGGDGGGSGNEEKVKTSVRRDKKKEDGTFYRLAYSSLLMIAFALELSTHVN